MGIILKPIDVVDDITQEEFMEKYLKPRRPVVIKNMARKWPAYQKWTMEYVKEVVGDVEVPLYDSKKADPAAPINTPTTKMKFGDYIDLIQREPTDLRIFFFDPIKHANKLMDDFIAPKELMGGFLDKYPSMFLEGRVRSLFFILTLIWRIFSIRTSTEESMSSYLNINGKKDCTGFLTQPMPWKIMTSTILILKNIPPLMV
ncbi:Uncharacterised protein [Chryseobacterium carnipullorum]|uniref:Cupin-like domain-containing protein n=1 Tax=Chryseobacterium carnipullorum TaxID=1124835 RepID=A0A376ER35_CHRCU|nr:Uncharacterised protein [Chryseobacterium carnipullorum]